MPKYREGAEGYQPGCHDLPPCKERLVLIFVWFDQNLFGLTEKKTQKTPKTPTNPRCLQLPARIALTCVVARKTIKNCAHCLTNVPTDLLCIKPQSLLRLLHMMNVRFSLLNMAQRILGVTSPHFW
jgi:hypothetical protein